MLSKELLGAYADGIERLSAAARERVIQALERGRAEGLGVAAMRELAIEAVMAASMEYGNMARELACQLYERQTGEGTGFTGGVIDREAVGRRVRYKAGKLAAGGAEGYEGFLASCADHAEDLARRVVNEQVIGSCGRAAQALTGRHGKGADRATRFARVPQGGDTCTFCAMLASRGYVYWSASTAGQFNHYHSNCRCLVVPDDGSGEVEGYDPDEWLDRWLKYKEIDGRGDLTCEQKDALKRGVGTGVVLRTRADPALDYFGPAEDDDPDALARIKEDLAQSGVVTIVSARENEAIGYGPSSEPGKPGSIHVTEGMSLSAWMHEYKHFCQDRDLGFPTACRYFADRDLRLSMEEEAYRVEMDRAALYGYNDLVEKLQALFDDERRNLNGEP